MCYDRSIKVSAPTNQPTNKRTEGLIAAVEGEAAGTEQERQEKKEQQLS